jgi:hypothetical protein
MNVQSLTTAALEAGKGILHLAPTWVPRSFCIPGRRLKLHPNDYYAFGGNRGGIDERWFASTTPADNGPLTSENEGLSAVVFEDGATTRRFLLRDAIDALKSEIIGARLWNEFHAWTMYSKFFDNQGPLPFHIHHRDAHARLINRLGKPEAYFFPAQVNNYDADFPFTFFGLRSGVTKDQLRQCLANFNKGDNRITDLSTAYRLVPGTGWDVPGGILHAPGSLCTYEPQKASDVFAMYQSLVGDSIIPGELMWKDVPPDRQGDLDFLIEMIDWDANTDPQFAARRLMQPQPAHSIEEMAALGYSENWICYRSSEFSAKELTVNPGASVTISDSAAYGFIVLQGHGSAGAWDIESPALIRFGQVTQDEYFVTEKAAREGVRFSNPSRSDPLVLLKHFGPGNPDLALKGN